MSVDARPEDPLPTAPRKPVVLCADDYGITAGVSRAILELARLGRISATSVMANMPLWPRLAPDLRALDWAIGIGLHLNLTTGAPLGAMPAFAPEGFFPALGQVLPRALAGRLPIGEVAQEIERQLSAFEACFGRAPDFVDGHQHVHALPGIRQALIAAFVRRSGQGRPWLRDPSDDFAALRERPLARRKALVVAMLSLGFRRAVHSAGFETNQGFSGFSPFAPDVPPDAVFEQAFRHLGPRPLVMCHPGHVDDELRALDPVVESRAQEFAYLMSDRFAVLLATRGVSLTMRPA